MKKVYLYVATAIFCWSTIATVSKLMLGDLNCMQLLWFNSFVAASALAVVSFANGKIKKLKNYKFKDFALSILVGFPGTFFYYVFYYAGTDRMLASQAFIVNYLWPIMSVVFACLILGEKLTTRKIIAILISFFGVAIVTGGDLMQMNGNIVMGVLMCTLGAVSYGLFTSLNQKVDYDKSLTVMISYTGTFLVTTIVNGINGDLFLPSLMQAPGFLWNGIFTMAVADTAWILALEKGNTAKISNCAYITPFLSMVWTALILKEAITLKAVIGLSVMIMGIFIQLKGKSEKGHKL